MPDMSPEVNEIAAALAKAQASFPVIKKESKAEIRSARGNYEYHYASLGAVIEAIRGPLSANGISYTQPIEESDHGTFLATLLIHTSGQWICSRLKIPTADLIGPQAIGSYIAYARRYSIASLTGIAIEDDDGRVAQRQAERQQPQLAPAAAPPPRRDAGSDDDRPPAPSKAIVGSRQANGREPRTVGKVRNGTWLYNAADKQGLLDEFKSLGDRLGYPARIIDWTPAQVAGAIQIRRERLTQ